MKIRVTCPGCQASLIAGESLINKRVKCPKCGNTVLVTPPTETKTNSTNSLIPTVEFPELPFGSDATSPDDFGGTDYGSSDTPGGDWSEFASDIPAPTHFSSASYVPPKSPAPAAPEKASPQFNFVTVVKTLVIALPIATILLFVLALNAATLWGFLISAAIALLVWLGGIGMTIYCYRCDEEGFSSIGKWLNSAGVLLAPLPLAVLLHLTATQENRSSFIHQLSSMVTNMRYATESNAFELTEVPAPEFKYSAPSTQPITSKQGAIEIVELRDLGKVNKVLWANDARQAYLVTDNGIDNQKLWRYDRSQGLTACVEIPFEVALGKSLTDLVIVRSKIPQIYFLDATELKVSSSRTVLKSFGLISHPASPLVIVHTNDDLERIIDVPSRQQVAKLDATYFPDEHWPEHNGRPDPFNALTARMQFSQDGQSLMCVGGIFKIEGPKLTWSGPSPKAYWEIKTGDVVPLSGGVARLEYLSQYGNVAKISYRNAKNGETSSEVSATYNDFVLPGASSAECDLISVHPSQTAAAIGSNASGEYRQYILFIDKE